MQKNREVIINQKLIRKLRILKKNFNCREIPKEEDKNYSGAQKKKTPVQKKKTPYEKNEPRKKSFNKSFIFLVDKLNMMDFNIFSILKLIVTCESCAISITK